LQNLAAQAKERRWWPVVVPLVLAAFGISILLPAGRHFWALSLFRQPTHYTALAFENPQALPATAVYREPLAISFELGNHEGHAIAYRYIIRQTAAGNSEVLKAATRTIAAGATETISAIVAPSCANSPCRIQVSLPGRPETIELLLTLTPKPAANG
jgi:hypothetical protein